MEVGCRLPFATSNLRVFDPGYYRGRGNRFRTHSCLAERRGVIFRDSLIYADCEHPVTAAYQPGHTALSMARAALIYAVHSFILSFVKHLSRPYCMSGTHSAGG